MTDHLPMPIPAPLTLAQTTALANLVRRAARAEILPRFRKLDVSEIDAKSSPLDLVTAADHGAEAIITRGLQVAFPSALVVGEEAVEKDPELTRHIAEAELCFLVDPVDGTWNFAHGLPLFGTMVAACRFGQPVFGLIYDPIGDDLIIADETTPTEIWPRSGPSRRQHTARPKPRDELIGYVHLSLMAPGDKPYAASRLQQFAHVTALRCSAHEYRLLAEGAVDFVLSGQLTPWDHAAGTLMCRQSGGHVALLDGTSYRAVPAKGYLLSASSESVWKDVADAFAGLLSED